MKNKLSKFIKSQRGVNTVEIVIILAVLVGLAIIFRAKISEFAIGIMDTIFKDTKVQDLSPSSLGTP